MLEEQKLDPKRSEDKIEIQESDRSMKNELREITDYCQESIIKILNFTRAKAKKIAEEEVTKIPQGDILLLISRTLAELKIEMIKSNAELKTEMNELKVTMNESNAELKTEMNELKATMNESNAELKAEMKELKATMNESNKEMVMLSYSQENIRKEIKDIQVACESSSINAQNNFKATTELIAEYKVRIEKLASIVLQKENFAAKKIDEVADTVSEFSEKLKKVYEEVFPEENK